MGNTDFFDHKNPLAPHSIATIIHVAHGAVKEVLKISELKPDTGVIINTCEDGGGHTTLHTVWSSNTFPPHPRVHDKKTYFASENFFSFEEGL